MGNLNIKAAAQQAGLSPESEKLISDMVKALSVHQELLNLPENLATKRADQILTPAQKEYNARLFGDDKTPDPSRGALQSAWHYFKVGFTGILREPADFMTRAYRTVAIANDQNKPLFGAGNAWDIANDKGEKVFRPTVIAEVRKTYGDVYTDLAMRIASGEDPQKVFAQATEAQKQILAESQQNKDNGLFKQVLDDVNKAHYSPGRDIAGKLNLDGKAYTFVSGFGDSVFRVIADPLIVAGKAKRMWDVGTIALDVVTKGNKVDKVFQSKNVINFWDQYGSLLGKLEQAQKTAQKASKAAKSATKPAVVERHRSALTAAREEAAAARTELKRLAPEFGDTVINEFMSANVAIRNATDAKQFFQNMEDVMALMKGMSGRSTPLMPRLNAARKARVAMYTTADKVFNINKIGSDFLSAMYKAEVGTEDIVTGIINNPVELGQAIKKGTASSRYGIDKVAQRIDSFAAKFEKLPIVREGFLDVTNPEAVTTIYRIARLSLPRYQSKMIAEAFAAGDVGMKKELFYGLWNTVASVRGVTKTGAGQDIFRNLLGKVEAYGSRMVVRDNAGKVIREVEPPKTAIGEWQLSDLVSMPSIKEMDQLAARDGIIGQIMGLSHKKWVENLTSYWSFLTLAGPRYAIRNATEDLMMHLAVGATPWGIAKGKWISNTIRLASDGTDVGLFTRMATRGSKERYIAASAAIKADKNLTDAQKVKELRGLVNEALTETKFSRILNDTEREFLKEQITLTNLYHSLDEVTEGAGNAYRGTDEMSRSLNLAKAHGKVVAVEFDKAAYARGKGTKGFGDINPNASTSAKVSWLMLIDRWSQDSLGKIAMANLDGINGNKKAIKALTQFLNDPKNASLVAKFRLTEQGITTEQHAQRVVDEVANLFSKQDGSLNKAFYKSVVGPDGIKTAGLGLDDLPKSMREMPASLTGPIYVPVAEENNITSKMLDKGWDWLGDMNARYSREPLFYETMLSIRNRMAKTGFDKRYIEAVKKSLVADGATAASAEKIARTRLAEYVNEKAISHTLAFVDNPLIQSQMAFSVRNFARFYRATEDFFRRTARMVRYNPDTIARFGLVYDGISHSGWIQEDENGERYFIYPGLPMVYKAIYGVFSGFNMTEAFKTPMPVRFGAKVNMLTPSLNPESIVPTLAGPLSAFSMNVISNLVGLVDKNKAESIKRIAMGPYSVNQSMLDSMLPAHVNRVLNALNPDDADSQKGSAMRKAITYLEAAGYSPKPKMGPNGEMIPPTPAELQEYKERLKNVTNSILMLRFSFGFFAPASPQLNYRSDMAEWLRDTGTSSWKAAWRDMLAEYDNDYEKAMDQWVKFYPDQVPYTVGENEKTVQADIMAAKKADAFLTENAELVAKYREGAMFLAPLDGEFDYEAWRKLKSLGVYKAKSALGTFLQEVQTSWDYQYLKYQQRDYKQALANASADWERKELSGQWESWSAAYKSTRPLLNQRLASMSDTKPKKLEALQDLVSLLNDKSVKVQPKTRAALQQMLALYDQYNEVKNNTVLGNSGISLTQDDIRAEMENLARTNANAGAVYTTLFSYLMEN